MAATETTATEAPSTEANEPGTGDARAASDPKIALRQKMVNKAAAKMAERAKEENLSAVGGDATAESSDGKPDGKKAASKDPKQAAAKDGKAKEEPKGDDESLTKGWRDLRRAKRKFADSEAKLTERESKVSSFEAKLAAEAEEFEKDPLAWLRKRGKNPREALLRIAKEDGEDPKDKALREVTTKLGDVEKKLTEREEREKQEREQEAKAKEANQKLETQIGEAFEEADHTAYPILAEMAPGERASLARAVLLQYFRNTEEAEGKGRLLTPEQLFQRLEASLRKKAESGKGKAGKSGTPDRARTAAKRDAENPEDDENSSRPADVTNRETRQVTRPSVSDAKSALRKKLVRMAAERIVP